MNLGVRNDRKLGSNNIAHKIIGFAMISREITFRAGPHLVDFSCGDGPCGGGIRGHVFEVLGASVVDSGDVVDVSCSKSGQKGQRSSPHHHGRALESL